MIKKSIAVSLIQYNCPQEKGEALDNIFDLIEQAGSNPDLILIAETPYTPYTTVNDFTNVAEFIPGYYSDRLAQLAKMRNAYICSGIVEKDGNTIYNSAILISPDGDIIWQNWHFDLYRYFYREAHLPHGRLKTRFNPCSCLWIS